jgi:hypothetical protein
MRSIWHHISIRLACRGLGELFATFHPLVIGRFF